MLIHNNSQPVRIIGQGLVAKELQAFLSREGIEVWCIGFEELMSDTSADRCQYMIGIADNQVLRFSIAQWLSDSNLHKCSWIHEKSVVTTDIIGQGVVCYPYSFILDADIGDHCFVGPYCHVGHNAKMHEGGVLLPYSRMLGSSILGRYGQLQSGSCLLDKRIVSADFVTILAGSTVTKDILEQGSYGGFPARRVPRKTND